MTLEIEKAWGTIKLIDGTQIELDGQSFDIMTIKDPNMICDLGGNGELNLETKHGIITFPDAQNVRLFIGHNQMLKQKERQQQIYEIENEIAGHKYQMEIPGQNSGFMNDYHETAIKQLESRMADLMEIDNGGDHSPHQPKKENRHG